MPLEIAPPADSELRLPQHQQSPNNETHSVGESSIHNDVFHNPHQFIYRTTSRTSPKMTERIPPSLNVIQGCCTTTRSPHEFLAGADDRCLNYEAHSPHKPLPDPPSTQSQGSIDKQRTPTREGMHLLNYSTSRSGATSELPAHADLARRHRQGCSEAEERLKGRVKQLALAFFTTC